MQLMLAKQVLIALGAIYFMLMPLANNLLSNPIKVLSHTETQNYVVFHVAAKTRTEERPLKVIIPKDKTNGKIKISFRNKNENVEFDIEQSGEIAEELKPHLDEIFKQITQYTKSKPGIRNKLKSFIKNYVNKKL